MHFMFNATLPFRLRGMISFTNIYRLLIALYQGHNIKYNNILILHLFCFTFLWCFLRVIDTPLKINKKHSILYCIKRLLYIALCSILLLYIFTQFIVNKYLYDWPKIRFSCPPKIHQELPKSLY